MYFVASDLKSLLQIADLSIDNCSPKGKEKKYGAFGFGLWRRGCKFC